MKEKGLIRKIKKYADYLDKEIEKHLRSAGLINETVYSIGQETYARKLMLARDRLYEIFPEIKPAVYKTVADLDKEKVDEKRKIEDLMKEIKDRDDARLKELGLKSYNIL